MAQRRCDQVSQESIKRQRFLEALDSYKPTVPEEVTAYYLQHAGVTLPSSEKDASRIKRLVSLAADRLVLDLLRETELHSNMRKMKPHETVPDDGNPPASEPIALDDLIPSLRHYGIFKEDKAKEPPPPTSTTGKR